MNGKTITVATTTAAALMLAACGGTDYSAATDEMRARGVYVSEDDFQDMAETICDVKRDGSPDEAQVGVLQLLGATEREAWAYVDVATRYVCP